MGEIGLTGLIGLIGLIYFKRRLGGKESTPRAYITLEGARQKGLKILHQATKLAQTILGQAELEGIKVVADSKFRTKTLEQRFEQQLTETAARLELTFTQETLQAEKEFIQYLADLKVRTEQTQNILIQNLEQQTGELLKKLRQNLTAFSTQTQQQSLSLADQELKEAKKVIEDYKRQKLALIDEQIGQILEKTISRVLSKKLSLKDQMELVYEALEQAKKDQLVE